MDPVYFYLIAAVAAVIFIMKNLGKVIFLGLLSIGVWWLYTWFQIPQ